MISFPDKKYTIIYADPPWRYRNKNTGGSLVSGADHKYSTMSLDEICNLPIHKIRASNSVLFLWVTVPLLLEGFIVMDAWGFKYKTMLTWVKTNRLGMGFWFRGQTEHLLLGVRGKVKAFRSQEPNVIQCRPEKHSKKPDAFRALIERATADMGGERIELFARQRTPGWDVWGNEV
ncbi:MAG: DNA methyltransferase [Deltaproteobacteria bacterium]|nr:DNA methyltransferase [Deltaproteobacteria bacterium]